MRKPDELKRFDPKEGEEVATETATEETGSEEASGEEQD
jgi:hypothetical protein